MIRKFQTEDTDAVVSIWRVASAIAHPFFSEEFTAQEADNLRNIYVKNAETWVLEDRESPVGFIALIEDEIGGLFLDPSFHGRGFGRLMVDHAVELKGPLRVEVFEENSIGRRFYERYGFVEVGQYIFERNGEVVRKLALPTN